MFLRAFCNCYDRRYFLVLTARTGMARAFDTQRGSETCKVWFVYEPQNTQDIPWKLFNLCHPNPFTFIYISLWLSFEAIPLHLQNLVPSSSHLRHLQRFFRSVASEVQLGFDFTCGPLEHDPSSCSLNRSMMNFFEGLIFINGNVYKSKSFPCTSRDAPLRFKK